MEKLRTAYVEAPIRQAGAVPESTINFLIWEMLVRCNNDGRQPPTILLEPVRLQPGIRPLEQSRLDEELSWKIEGARRYAFNNPSASLRDIAKLYSVNVSTVSRWNKKYNIREGGEKLQKMIDEIDKQLADLRKKHQS